MFRSREFIKPYSILCSWPPFPDCMHCITDSLWPTSLNLHWINEWAIVHLFSYNQKQQLELEQLHCDFERLRSQEHHKSRQLEELKWVSSLLSWPAFKRLPYGGLWVTCLFWFTSSISLCHLSSFCQFIFLSLRSSDCHPIYSMSLSLWSDTVI